MKGVFVLIGLMTICCVAFGLFFGYHTTKDPGHQLAVGFGSSRGDGLMFQVGIGTMAMMRAPPPTNARGVPLWNEWIPEHVVLRDADGKILPLNKIGTSRLFLDDRAAGSPEVVLAAEVAKGKAYTCDYIPDDGKGKVYRSEFVAPEGGEKVRRFHFAPYEDDDA